MTVPPQDHLFQNDSNYAALVKAQIDIGRIENDVNHIMRTVERIQTDFRALETRLQGDLKTVDDKLEAIQLTLTEARGGWKFLMSLGGLFGMIGAAVTWAATHLTWKM